MGRLDGEDAARDLVTTLLIAFARPRPVVAEHDGLEVSQRSWEPAWMNGPRVQRRLLSLSVGDRAEPVHTVRSR